MPWYIPDGNQTRSMTKTGGIFSKYRTIDSCAHFLLQEKKERKFKVRWPKKLQDSRPPYRIISRPQDQSRPPLKVAYSDNLESLRKVEWWFCTEKFGGYFPKGLSSSQQWKWTEAFFTSLAIESGAEVGERDEKAKEEKGRPKEERGKELPKEKQLDDGEIEEKKKGFSAKTMMKNLRSVFKAKEKEPSGKASRSPSPSNKSPSTKSTAPSKSPHHTRSSQQLGLMDNSPKDGSPSDAQERELYTRNLRQGRRTRYRRRNSTSDLKDIAQRLYNKDSTDENEVLSGENNRAMATRNAERKLFRRKRASNVVGFRSSDYRTYDSPQDNDDMLQNNASSPVPQDKDSVPVCVLIPIDGYLTFFWMAAAMASLMWFLRDFSHLILIICVVVIVLMMFSVVVLRYPFALFVHIKVHRNFLQPEAGRFNGEIACR